MAEVVLYHPKTEETYVAPSERSAEVLKKSGWTEKPEEPEKKPGRSSRPSNGEEN